MKKFLPAILITILCALPLAACDCSGGGFSDTPHQEYSRVYSLAGSGVTFDFTEHDTFSVSSSGTFSGGNIKDEIEMSSLYQHDYRKRNESEKSYAYFKSVNSVSVTGAGVEPYLEENETGFQYIDDSSVKGWYYLESHKTEQGWSNPVSTASGNGDYEDLFVSDAHKDSSDRLVRNGSRLFNPEYLENFDGGRTSGYYIVTADVKADKISEFAEWLSKFFPLFRLKDTMNTDREWKFFDLSGAAENYRGHIEIRSTSVSLTDVVVSFETLSPEYTGMGKFEFRARTTFKSGGVTVKNLSYFS